jgi:hypothetical protein
MAIHGRKKMTPRYIQTTNRVMPLPHVNFDAAAMISGNGTRRLAVGGQNIASSGAAKSKIIILFLKRFLALIFLFSANALVYSSSYEGTIGNNYVWLSLQNIAADGSISGI